MVGTYILSVTNTYSHLLKSVKETQEWEVIHTLFTPFQDQIKNDQIIVEMPYKIPILKWYLSITLLLSGKTRRLCTFCRIKLCLYIVEMFAIGFILNVQKLYEI